MVDEALEEGPPGGEELLRPSDRTLDPEEGEQGRLDPAPLRLVGDVLREHLADLRSGRRLIVGLDEARSPANHLAERPEADPLAVGWRAAIMEPDGIDQAVDVLQELPGQAGLADACRADHRDESSPAIPARRVEEILELADLVVAADERSLEPFRAVPAATLGHDPEGAPGRHRAGLALEGLVAGLLEDDRGRCRPLGRFADQDGAWAPRRTAADSRC